MKTDLSEIAKAYLGAGVFFTIAGEGGMLFLANYNYIREPDYLLPALAGFSIPALPFGIHLAGRVARLSRPPERSRPAGREPQHSLAHTVASWLAGQPKAPPGDWGFSEDVSQRAIKYRPEPRESFIFFADGMPSMITEERLFEFCRIAWRRQQHVLYGNLKSNRIFSRNFFTRQSRPKFTLPEYLSCMYILARTNLILNRWQGKGGQLRFPPYATVMEAKLRW